MVIHFHQDDPYNAISELVYEQQGYSILNSEISALWIN